VARAAGKERWLWLAALAWTATIYSTLYVARPVAEFLRDRNLLRLTVLGVVVVLVVAVSAWGIRRRLPARAWGVLACGALVFGALASRLSPVEVKLHCVEYGVLGGLFYLALAQRRRRAALPAAIVLTATAGWLDEGIQYLLPNRWYDLADVALNAASGALGAGLVALLRPLVPTPR
jgi:hypothetical protein